jgi:PhnB protein
MSVKPIPDGYHTATVYMIVKGCAEALDFYKKAFGANVRMTMPGPGGRIMHAEFTLGDSTIMLADEVPERDALSPQTIGGTPFGICLYVPDVDAAFERAIAAGGKVIYPVKDQFYGDRSGSLIDPFGHKWTIATHIEDVSPEEMQRRSEAMMKEFCENATANAAS